MRSIWHKDIVHIVHAAFDSPGDKVVTFTAPPPTEFTSIGIEVTDTGSPIELESHVLILGSTRDSASRLYTRTIT
jgi:hypothetical protein